MLRLPHNPGPYDDDWEDLPTGGAWQKHILGLVLAGALAGFGVYSLLTGGVPWMTRDRNVYRLTGSLGIAMAVALIGMGLIVHCHHYWGRIYHLSAAATVGKITGLVMMIGGVGFLIVRIGVYGH
jgi:hypothetical protein